MDGGRRQKRPGGAGRGCDAGNSEAERANGTAAEHLAEARGFDDAEQDQAGSGRRAEDDWVFRPQQDGLPQLGADDAQERDGAGPLQGPG